MTDTTREAVDVSLEAVTIATEDSAAAAAQATAPSSVCVEIVNLHENERLTYPLVLVEGLVVAPPASDDSTSAIQFIHTSVRGASASSALPWPVVPETGHFKALVMLPRPGTHCIQLRVHGELVHELTIRYTHLLSRHIARFHYEKQVNDSRGFDAPTGVDNSDAAALKRVKLGALLMQTCIAEMFHKQGLPRATIALEFDDSSECEIPRANILETSDDSAIALNDRIASALSDQNVFAAADGVTLTHFVHVGSNHYDPETRTVPNHCATMFDNAVLFSATTLHTWPSTLGEVTKCLLDNTQIDTSILHEDGAGECSYWANFATGFGVFMHFFFRSIATRRSEIGMFGRGFDNINCLLCVYQPEYNCPHPECRCQKPVIELLEGDDAGDVRLELNYHLLETLGDDYAGAYVEKRVLRPLLRRCPFIMSKDKITSDQASAAAAA